jgi:hypothetical protein
MQSLPASGNDDATHSRMVRVVSGYFTREKSITNALEEREKIPKTMGLLTPEERAQLLDVLRRHPSVPADRLLPVRPTVSELEKRSDDYLRRLTQRNQQAMLRIQNAEREALRELRCLLEMPIGADHETLRRRLKIRRLEEELAQQSRRLFRLGEEGIEALGIRVMRGDAHGFRQNGRYYRFLAVPLSPPNDDDDDDHSTTSPLVDGTAAFEGLDLTEIELDD